MAPLTHEEHEHEMVAMEEARTSIYKPLIGALISALVVGVGSYVALVTRSVTKGDLKEAIAQVSSSEQEFVNRLEEQLTVLDNKIEGITISQVTERQDVTKLTVILETVRDVATTNQQRIADLEFRIKILEAKLADVEAQ